MTTGKWTLAEKRIRMAPSLLSADFARAAEAIAKIEAAGADIVHLDVMDGHFVPNISFGVPVIAKLRPVTKLFFDTHLMITDPLKYAEPFVKAGCDSLTFHIEVADEPLKVIEHIRSLDCRVGISLNPGTEVEAVAPVVEHVDLVLVMSVWPGFGGQEFIPSALGKLEQLSGMLRADQRLEVDGGIGSDTVDDVVRTGADTLVAGSAIFGEDDPTAACRQLQAQAEKVKR